MKKLLFLMLLVPSVGFSQSNKKIEEKYSTITVSCDAGPAVGTASIIIMWFESDYKSGSVVQDGFNNGRFLGQVSQNYFTWDRGANIGILDRYSGILSIKTKDESPIQVQCRKVEKKF